MMKTMLVLACTYPFETAPRVQVAARLVLSHSTTSRMCYCPWEWYGDEPLEVI